VKAEGGSAKTESAITDKSSAKTESALADKSSVNTDTATADKIAGGAAIADKGTVPTETAIAEKESVKTETAMADKASVKTDKPPEKRAVPDEPEVPPEIASLIAARRWQKAQLRLLEEQKAHPRAAWVHRALAEVYYRQLWRKDAAVEWDHALRLDPQLAKDERLGEALCTALGPQWDGAGERLLVDRFGADAVAPMKRCLAEVRDLARVQAAARVLEKVGAAGAIDRGLVALKTLEQGPTCPERRAAVQTIVRLRDGRARQTLTRFQRDPCVASVAQGALAALKQ
jgi:hypothetical protein